MGSSVNVLAAGVVVASLAMPLATSAQPSGGTVVFGGATISTPSATSTLIKQSTNSAIINWQSFSLSSGSSVVFDQPGAASTALNRVLGGGVSQINGNLSANGQVWIINANGILFGKGSQINVAGLLATTSDIADGDFAAGRYSFSPSSNPSASVDNAGTIHVANGGSAVLSAPHVSNSGLIEADGGQIVLGGASAFTVDFEGDNLLRYAITTPVSATPTDANGIAQKELVGNSGTLSAAGGRILLTARAAANVADNVVNNSGMISATSAKLVNGEVVLDAGSGSIQDSGAIAATGNSVGESGGTVALAGNSVTVADGAVIDASGDSGGGTVSIGGGLHGSGPYQSAQNTTVAANATIHADAHTSGNGGTVSIWSVGTTRFAGTVTAMGGSQTGNGGLVETSGHILNVADGATVGTGAAHGSLGDWLLDPVTLTIVASSPNPDPTLSGGTLPYSDPASTITATTIELALGTTNVTLQAVDDIFVNAAIAAIATGHTLTLDAGRSIFVNADITVAGTGSAVVLSANNADANRTDPGAASISGTGVITGNTIDLVLASNGVDGGSIGSAGSAINIGKGVVSVQTNGADAYVQNASSVTTLVLGSSNVGAGHLTAVSSGDLTIAAGSVLASSASGDAIVLSAANDFINNAGSGAISLSGAGRFLIYSAAPGGDTFGGLNSGHTAIWNSVYPNAISAVGNRYVFALQPTLTVTSTNQAKTYGTDDSAALASAYTVSGFDPGVAGVYLADTAATALSGAPSITSAGSAASASVAGGPYAIAIAQGPLDSRSGYAFFFVSSGLLTVNAATLTYVADPFARTYGSPNPAFTGTVTGFVNSDTLASATTGTLTFTSPATASSNVGAYAIDGSGLTANNGNYVFVQAASNATALTITAATLTYVADPFGRAYGAANPVFTGTVTGFVNSDTLASATTGTLTFASPATPSSNVGSYAIDGSGLSANNGNYVFVQAASNATALTIGAATLTYVADPFARTYGSPNPTFTGTVTGFVNSDTLATATTGALTFTSPATASSNVGSYAIDGSGLTANNGNYVFVQAAGNATALTITAATLTYVADPFARTYGSANPDFTGTVTGFVNSDTLANATTGTLSFTSPATASSNVGSYAIDGSGLAANNGNYVFVQAAGNATALTINPATLTYVADPFARTYGSPNPAFTGTVTGFVNSDTVANATTGTLSFTSPATASSNVGSYAIDGSGLSANNGNYVFVQAASNATALTIGAATLTYVADPFARTYGAANPAFTGSVTGFVNSDTLASATTGILTFTSPATASSNVGSYAIDGSGLTANHGNYVFAQAAGNATALTINPATLTYVASTAARTYGSPNPAFTGTVTGFVNSDTLATATTGTLSFTSPATASSNVGSYAIDGSGLSANNGNYVFAQAAGNATALTINPATLTYVADPFARAYGTANPIFTGSVTGFVNSDTLASATTGTLTFTSPATASSSVGHYAINGSGLAANNGNYVFVQAAGNATALTITAALLSVVADPQSKVYGAADPALTYTFAGLVNGDTSAVFTGALTRAPGKNVGNYAITQGTLSAGANYTIAFTGANFAITPALLSVTANTQTKVYGAADPKLTYTFSGLVSGDTSAVFSGALSRAAGQNVGNYAITQGTLSAGANYTIAFTGANFAITPATLTYVANAVNRTYGSANPALGGTVTGFVNGDTLASATGGSLSFTTSATTGSNVGSYAITGSGLSANNGNYVFVQSAGNATALTINPATLTYVATSGAIDQGSPIPLLTGSVTGFVNGDTLQSATAGTLLFTTAATSSSPPGDYAITGSGLSANHGNYVFVQDPGNASALKINKIVVQNVPGLDGFYPWVSQGDPENSPLSLFDQENNGTDQYYVVADGGGGNNLPAPDTTTLSGPIAELTAAQGYLDPATNSDRRSSSLSHYFGNGSLFDDNFPSWGNDSYWH